MTLSLSSHVLDTTLGKPAAGLSLTLHTPAGATIDAQTDSDGRCREWGDTVFAAGGYRLRFHVKSYLEQNHGKSFYPFVDINFDLDAEGGHYHVPLLINPFGYSTYRGS
jgi:5-hydroxyisourate hydrolase